MVDHFVSNPRRLFIVDGVGAVVSSFMLGIVLVLLNSYIGIPKKALFFLAVFPVIFGLVDLYAYKQSAERWPALLKGIAIGNLMYCFVSVACACLHWESIKPLGWIYLVLEILILIVLLRVEFKTAKAIMAH